MSKLRFFFGIFLLISLFSLVLAYQAPLTEFGFNGIILEKQSTKECKEIIFTIPDSAKDENGEGILSISGEFLDYQNDSSYITVSINGSEEKVLWPENFSCTQNCWARLFISELKSGQAKATICAHIGSLTKKVEIKGSSFVGLYDTPVLTIENDAPGVLFLGSRAKMSIVVSNTGTKAANIFVQFVHPDTRAKVTITSFDIVEGASSASATILPNESKKFDYYIKPTVISSYNLPSAALFFNNYFGEKEVLISEHPQMSVINPNHIDISFVAINETAPHTFKAIIKNNWAETFEGTIIVSPQTAIRNSTQEIILSGNTEKEILLQAEMLPAGKYSFFATITDQNNIFSSNKIELEVTNQAFPFEIVLAILAILAGVGIFLWISYKK